MSASPPVRLDLTIYAGATFRQSFRWKVGTDYVDLDGYSAHMQVRADYTRGVTQVVQVGTLMAEFSSDDESIELNDPHGTVALYMSAEDTLSLEAIPCTYDLVLTNGVGEVIRLLMGSVTISAPVTYP